MILILSEGNIDKYKNNTALPQGKSTQTTIYHFSISSR